jgi:Zn-dependent protease
MTRFGREPGPFDAADAGGRGRAGRFFARVFENPDNPLGWSLRLFTAAGIAVRVHLFTIIFMIGQLLWSIPQGNAGVGFMALAMGTMFAIVLLHEFGHCVACRMVRGVADRIVVLPIGGLALCRPPDHWKAHLVTTAGGPLVNVALVPITAAALWWWGLGSVIVFNPFAPVAVLSDPAFASASSAVFWIKVALWWSHYMNLVILAFNVLVPAYPMDGGRLLQAALWSRVSYERATERTVLVGYVASMGLAVVGVASNQALLVIIAALSFWSCWVERKRLRGEVDLGAEGYALGASLGAGEGDAGDLEDPWTIRAREREARAREAEQAEVDRILDKIARSGMASLTRGERRSLDNASRRKRREEGTR